jgi:FtsP/CotA-like multicopper oxidase with cupredoxin domain
VEYLQGKEGETIMVNGEMNPVLPIRPGQVQRWRILNASNARFYKLSLEKHPLFVIGTDGGLLDKPYSLTSLVLAPGERLDVLIKADQAVKNYRLLSLPYNRGNGSTAGQTTLMTLSCKGAAMHDELPAGVNPHAGRLSVKPAKTERIVLGAGRGKAHINGISFDSVTAFTIESEVGAYEAWELVNRSDMDQPFHLHVNPFQVLSLTGGDQVYATFYTRTPAWKDTVIVPRWGSARILVPVSDFPGTAMFNSHIVEHADLGMMGLWDIAERAEDEEAEGTDLL